MVPDVPKVPKVPVVRALSLAARWFDRGDGSSNVRAADCRLAARVVRDAPGSTPVGLGAWLGGLRLCRSDLDADDHCDTGATIDLGPGCQANRNVLCRRRRRPLHSDGAFDWRRAGAMRRSWLPVLLMAVPAALTMAFPFAMVIAVDAIRRDADVPRHAERAAAVKLALFALLLMLSVGGFVVPLASQEFRELCNAGRLERSGAPVARAFDLLAADAPGTNHRDPRDATLHAGRRNPS